MSSKDQEILRLRAELAKLQAEKARLEEESYKLESEKTRLEKESHELKSEKIRLEEESRKLQSEKEQMQGIIDSLQNQMAWFRKKLFGSMSEKKLPLLPSVLEPTLFDIPFRRKNRLHWMRRSRRWRSRMQRPSK